jgi:hypothetical protein
VEVVVLGMDPRQVNLLGMVFAGPGRSCCVVAADERAQAGVIDLDGVGAEEGLHRQRRLYPGRPLLLIAQCRPQDSMIGSDLFLPKPIRVDALVEAATVLRARVGSPAASVPVDPSVPAAASVPMETSVPAETSVPMETSVPAETSVPMETSVPAETSDRPVRCKPWVCSPRGPSTSTPRAVGGAVPSSVVGVGAAWEAAGRVSFYEPARYLQGLVVRARREALRRCGAAHLEGPWPTITLLPACGSAVVIGGPEALQPFATQYDLPSCGRVTFTPAPLFSPHHPGAVDLEALVWELALGASAGRVPQGTHPGGLCALRERPDFARLAPPPGSMSIAALWTRRLITIEDTARTLQIPLREVCNFYSAAHAVGLITPVADVGPAASAVRSVAPSPRPGLLQRVFERLHVA